MMNRLSKAGLFAALSVAAMGCVSLAQAPASPALSGCENNHKVLVPKNPRMGANANILPGQVIVQLRLTLDENTRVKVVEYPRSSKDVDSYNSTIIIQRGQEQKEYALGRLIQPGSGLRLVEIASFCTSPDSGTVFLAFETPSIGATEGFAVIQYSAATVDVKVLPMADQGRIVVSKAEPDKVELWSATGSASVIDCDACNKHYAVQDCKIGEHGVMCKRHPGAGEVRSPSKVIGARIEVR